MDQKFLKRAKRNDRWARYGITLGGVSIIFCVVLILLLIAKVSVPLFLPADADVFAKFSLQGEKQDHPILTSGVDEYLETAFSIDKTGMVRFVDTRRSQLVFQKQLQSANGGKKILAIDSYGAQKFNLLWDDGSLGLIQVQFKPEFDAEGTRTIRPVIKQIKKLPTPENGIPLKSLARFHEEENRTTRVDLMQDGSLHLRQWVVQEDMLGEEEEVVQHTRLTEGRETLTAMALGTLGDILYVGTDKGELLRWQLADPEEVALTEKVDASGDGTAITALAMLLGDISVLVGDDKGRVASWFPVRKPEQGKGKFLEKIHTLKPHGAPIKQFVPSSRNKGFYSLDATGKIHLNHTTSERLLLTFEEPGKTERISASIRDNGLLAQSADGKVTIWEVDNPHPEISWTTLFGKVWYESYDEPSYSWQSSSGSDDFEPKLSLTPLIFGTIKGTVYAMLFAVPVALLGAIYTSQFASARTREMIKPTVEIMAAIPTVVIGFLAALWLAPLVEINVVAVFITFILTPFVFFGFLALWDQFRKKDQVKDLEKGNEFLVIAPIFIFSLFVAYLLGPFFEGVLFDGSFKLWLFNSAGMRYDPRNCMIIALAMGFAVIPIIFTIAEDSLSNVPKPLKAASLAVGASRWQTVARVILPSASPGIFAGTMIGFGRAIGETMIVLMATGNTAIMEWSIFNGMRPLSANIAVEIPEAPVGGTLYRVLFLSAVILFVMTFVLNTVAEVVRQRLRRKYGRF